MAEASDPSNRFVYINSGELLSFTIIKEPCLIYRGLDISAGDTAVRRGILNRLNELLPGFYTEANVALVGTHSHSGVGGYLNNLLPQLTSLGFVRLVCLLLSGTISLYSLLARRTRLLSMGPSKRYYKPITPWHLVVCPWETQLSKTPQSTVLRPPISQIQRRRGCYTLETSIIRCPC